LGRRRDEAWALGNAGVASFNLNRVAEAAADLEAAHDLFVELGDQGGAVSTSSFLCLVKPGDPRVPGWLADGLAFADQTGERNKQVGALSLLAWNHFVRSMWGSAAETADMERFATRLAETAEQIGADEMEMHGRSLLAVSCRWTGRLEEATDQQSRLARLLDGPSHHPAWIAWAAGFAVETAGGNMSAAPPFPPLDSTDSVAGMAGLVLRAELLFAGRIDEAMSRLDALAEVTGTVSDAAGVVDAMTYLLAGRLEEARQAARRAVHAAETLDAPPIRRMAAALLAEATGDTSDLAPPPQAARSISDAFVLRAHARAGHAGAFRGLEAAAGQLALPGLRLRV
jgi:tetratricopeptide (TPR) repeat protein